MAIVDMSNFRLLIFEEERAKLLNLLQEFEYVHFSFVEDEDMPERVQEPIVLEDSRISMDRLEYLLKVLEPRHKGPSGLTALRIGNDSYTFNELMDKGSRVDFNSVYEQVLEINKKIETNNKKISDINSRVNELRPWRKLEEAPSEMKDSENISMRLGTVLTRNVPDLRRRLADLEYSYFEELSESDSLTYGVAITMLSEHQEAMEILRELGFTTISLQGNRVPMDEISELEERRKSLKEENKKLDSELDVFTSELSDIELAYEYQKNQQLKLAASNNFLQVQNVNVIDGYIPTERVAEFKKLVNDNIGIYHLETEEAERTDDTVPVLLKNNKIVEAFESITKTYSMPTYGEIDPTLPLSIFYWAFFGMMVGDLGYGLLVTIATAIGLLFFNLSDDTRNSAKFFLFLGLSTTVWGLIFGSVFGISLPYEPLIDTSNTILMLIVAIGFGVIHLFAGLAIQAYMSIRDGKPLDAVYDVLIWYMVLIGAGLFLLSLAGIIGPEIGNIAKWVMIIGMIGVILFGGRESKGPARFAVGLYELYGISSWVGDFVSYSRLMALALSGGYIAVALNMIIGMVTGSAIGNIGGAFIFVFGHLFNAFLSYLSAYVHNARLTYVEFFGKFYEGGGKAFESFRADSKYINIK